MTTVVRPPKPFGCRRPPPPPISISEPFDDELGERLQLHALIDEALRGVLTPGDTRHVRPSYRLYTADFRRRPRDARARDAMTAAWRTRWFYARVQDAQYLPISALLSALGAPLLCRNTDPAIQLLAYFVGRAVHYRIMAAYRSVYRDNVVSCDNRVFFPDRTSERLSILARKDTRGVFGGLNWCLAGQRSDIIDVDRGEMWEIKPAALTSAAMLQLWGYLDNYEVARVITHYLGEPPLPAISAGAAEGLPSRVLQPFELNLSEGVTLTITPFTQRELPGLILYTVRVKTGPKRADRARARQAVAVTSSEIAEVLVGARRDMQHMIEVQDAETKRLLVYAGMAVLLAGVVLAGVAIAAGGAAVAAGAAATAGGEAAVGGLAAAELAAVSGQVISLGAARTAASIALETVVQATPRIAASVTIYLAGRQFSVPPETVGICIEGGCETGEAVTPGLPLR